MQILITDSNNIAYLTGYRPSESHREAYLLATFTDNPSEREKTSSTHTTPTKSDIQSLTIFNPLMLSSQVRAIIAGERENTSARQLPKTKIIELTPQKKLSEILPHKLKEKHLYCEGFSMHYDEFQSLKSALEKEKIKLEPINPNQHPILHVRRTKQHSEIELIKEAATISIKAFRRLIRELRDGISEWEAAHRLKQLMFEEGTHGEAFPPIVAFGENSAFPHHTPGAKKLTKNDIVLIDWGAKMHEYCADMTRSFIFTESNSTNKSDFGQNKKFFQTFEQVKSALLAAEKQLISGQNLSVISKSIEEELAKYAKLMPHSPGHGIGVEPHEAPFFRYVKNEVTEGKPDQQLQMGDVMAIEPAIYFEGDFGVRLENTYVVGELSSKPSTYQQESQHQQLSQHQKETKSQQRKTLEIPKLPLAATVKELRS